jgi:hypothetical protein
MLNPYVFSQLIGAALVTGQREMATLVKPDTILAQRLPSTG